MKIERHARTAIEGTPQNSSPDAVNFCAGMERMTEALLAASRSQREVGPVNAIFKAANACRIELNALVQQYANTLEGRTFTSSSELRPFVKELRALLQATGSRLQCPCCGQATLPAPSGNVSSRKFHFDHSGVPQMTCVGSGVKNRFGKGFDRLPAIIIVPAPARKKHWIERDA